MTPMSCYFFPFLSQLMEFKNIKRIHRTTKEANFQSVELSLLIVNSVKYFFFSLKIWLLVHQLDEFAKIWCGMEIYIYIYNHSFCTWQVSCWLELHLSDANAEKAMLHVTDILVGRIQKLKTTNIGWQQPCEDWAQVIQWSSVAGRRLSSNLVWPRSH